MPPPTHIVTTTFFTPRRLPSIRAWPTQARAAHAVGVADRDRAAVDVEQIVGDAELVLAVEHLDRERLVQFPQADVVDLEPETLEQFGHREHRADAHFVGLGARDRHADVAAERGQILLFAATSASMITHADEPSDSWLALPAVMWVSGAEHRLEARQAFERGVGAVAFVLVDRDFAHRDFAGFLVLDAHGRGDGDDLVVEAALGLGGGGALLRLRARIRPAVRG